ncbi:hypothetical protein DFQ29_007748 [Apophysomyces sp. BC1021]|nr:hypothetical protein DFQ29_007748 [Apophysomyces sp. BC1021]
MKESPSESSSTVDQDPQKIIESDLLTAAAGVSSEKACTHFTQMKDGKQKQCPTCRQTIVHRPVPSYTVQHQVHAFKKCFPKDCGVTAIEEVQYQSPEATWGQLFPIDSRTAFIQDVEDDVCSWELEPDGFCNHCGINYGFLSAQDHNRSSTDSSSSGEDDEDLEGFVVDDFEGENADDISDSDSDNDSDSSSSSNSNSDSNSDNDSDSDEIERLPLRNHSTRAEVVYVSSDEENENRDESDNEEHQGAYGFEYHDPTGSDSDEGSTSSDGDSSQVIASRYGSMTVHSSEGSVSDDSGTDEADVALNNTSSDNSSDEDEMNTKSHSIDETTDDSSSDFSSKPAGSAQKKSSLKRIIITSDEEEEEEEEAEENDDPNPQASTSSSTQRKTKRNRNKKRKGSRRS